MNCPRCKQKTIVTDSRAGVGVVIRVRKCKCGLVFKSAEYLDDSEETNEEFRELKKKAQWDFYKRQKEVQ